MTTRSDQHASNDNATISLEITAPGRWIAHLPDGVDLPLSAEGTDRKPRVRDLDLAAWLGFERPRDVRKLIKRMEREGKLRGVDYRATVARQSTGNGGSRQITVNEAWLTREQTLLVATQSDTPRAWELTELMVRVFDAVIDRQRAPAPVSTGIDPEMARAIASALAVVPQLAAQVTAMNAEIAALRADVSTGVIGEAVAMTEVVQPLRRVAALRAPDKRALRGERRRLENRLRSILGHAGPGSRWSMLPRRLLDVAQRQLAMWLDGAIDVHAANLRANQGRLPLAVGAN